MKRAAALLLALLLLASAGCAAPKTLRQQTIFAMNTVMDLRIYASDDSLLQEMTRLLSELDHELSATDAGSALYALNQTGQAENADLAQIVSRASAISDETGGALDISLYNASLAWGFPTGEHRVPDEAELAALRRTTGLDKVAVSGDVVTLSDGVKLDFGAVAKGLAADLCREKMENAGVSGILSLGASIQTVGTKPDGSDWSIGVQDPEDPSNIKLTLRLKGSKAVVTSGDYQRFFEQDGVRYCHILDPETLAPVQSDYRSVTIVADSGFLADGLSTALYVMGFEAGVSLWRTSGGFEAVWIADDGSVSVTEGLAPLVSGAEAEVIQR